MYIAHTNSSYKVRLVLGETDTTYRYSSFPEAVKFISTLHKVSKAKTKVQLLPEATKYKKYLKSPSKDYPPLGMNPEGLDLWEYILDRYADVIFTGSASHNEWKSACEIYTRVCKSRGIQGWLLGSSHTSHC
jgi:hypothetical protein